MVCPWAAPGARIWSISMSSVPCRMSVCVGFFPIIANAHCTPAEALPEAVRGYRRWTARKVRLAPRFARPERVLEDPRRPGGLPHFTLLPSCAWILSAECARFFFVCTAIATAQTGPVVTVTGGQIRGRPSADGGAEFKGISYALPPLGELRWREPQPVAAWSGIRDAAAFSVACTQISEGWNLRYVQSSAEDCLYLNVAAPVWPPAVKFPVMVWIHGGSNTAGSGEAAGFDQRTLVRRGLVLVTINYRLGALGFLAHTALARESAHHTSGNYGLMDQIAALEWVRRNIATFGGDPYKVTVAGQSAGAMDVSLLMTSPLARGLFRRAIAQSGAVSVFKGSRTRGQAEELG